MGRFSTRALSCGFSRRLSRTLSQGHRAGRCAQNSLQVLLTCYTMGRRRTRINLGLGPAFLPAAGTCLATREVHLGIRVAAAPAAPVGDVQAAVARVAPTAAGMVAMDWTKRCRRVRNAPLHHWDKSPDGRFHSKVG